MKLRIFLWLGLALVTAGIALISHPAALIFAGIALCGLALTAAFVKALPEAKKAVEAKR